MNFSSRYIGLIGLGLMFMWGSALMPWIDFSRSHHVAPQLMGFLGACLVSATGLATFLYVNFLEGEVKRLKERNETNEAEAQMWKDQAQQALSMIEKR